jgi:hypothetical protein
MSMLSKILSHPSEDLALKKAIFITKEKLSNPLKYKQQYARLVPFGDKEFVKASRRFYNPASVSLRLPDREDTTSRITTPVNMEQPVDNLRPFGPKKELVKGSRRKRELIADVGQKTLGECWLQAAAASLPRRTLINMFSWRPSYGSKGVTTRLHDKDGKPIYYTYTNESVME